MDSSIWRSISEHDAQLRGNYGFGGWILGFYFFAVLMVGWHLSSLLGDGRGLLMMFETPENVAKIRVILLIKILLWIPFLLLAPLRHRLMPPITIASILAATLLEAVTVIFLLELSFTKILSVNLFNLATLFIYTMYMEGSKRVNLTYRLRERNPDSGD